MVNVIDLDKVVRDYKIRVGNMVVGSTGEEGLIIKVEPVRRAIILKIGKKTYPEADLGTLAYNLIQGKWQIREVIKDV